MGRDIITAELCGIDKEIWGEGHADSDFVRGAERVNGTCSTKFTCVAIHTFFFRVSFISSLSDMYHIDSHSNYAQEEDFDGLEPLGSDLDDDDEFGMGFPPSLSTGSTSQESMAPTSLGSIAPTSLGSMGRSLRSRPPMDFSSRQSTQGSDFGHSGSNIGLPYLQSRMSNSTLAMAHPFLRKNPSFPSNSRPSQEVIASLTVAELSYNPHYRQLRKKYDHVTTVLATFVERDLAESRTAKSTGSVIVPDVYQGVWHLFEPRIADSKIIAITPGIANAHSRTSSLGPSDSASQQTKLDISMDAATQDLLDRVEPPPLRPPFLPHSVLWEYEDCKTDTSEGVVVTEANRHRPRMSLAIRRPDGKKVSTLQYSNMRHSAEIICQRLINLAYSDPRSAILLGDSKAPTKSFFKRNFKNEYFAAILELEAEQTLLRLCSGHWKADAMLGQVFLRRSDQDSKSSSNPGRAASSLADPLSAKDFRPLEPVIPQARVVATTAAKRAFEASPGPKSPSASHVQKRTKDASVVSRQKKTTGSEDRKFSLYLTIIEPADKESLCTGPQRPAARKLTSLTPSFLSRTAEDITADPAPVNLRSAFVDPPGSEPAPVNLSSAFIDPSGAEPAPTNIYSVFVDPSGASTIHPLFKFHVLSHIHSY